MVAVRQSSAMLVLVTLTLILQSPGMAALTQWAKAHLSRGIHRFGTVRSAVLVIRLTSGCLLVYLAFLPFCLQPPGVAPTSLPHATPQRLEQRLKKRVTYR